MNLKKAMLIKGNLRSMRLILGIMFILLSTSGTSQHTKSAFDINRKVDNVKIIPVTLDRLDLKWNEVDGATGYKIFRGISRNFIPNDENLIAICNTNTYSNRELSPSTTYFYRIKAVAGVKESKLSEEVSGTTLHKDLALSIDKSRWTVEGDAFRITWDASKGGEITEIKQYDGSNWIQINQHSDENLNTIPGYVLQDNKGISYYLSNCRDATFQIIKITTDEIVISSEAPVMSIDGQKPGWIIRQIFRVFKEGLLFCDLEIILPEGSDEFNVTYSKLGLTISSDISKQKLNWGYFKRNDSRLITWKSIHDKVEEKCMYPYIGIDYGVSEKSSFTNHVAFFIEDWKALAGYKELSGSKFSLNEKSEMSYEWILYEGNPISVKAPYTYRNRWGIGLGAMRKTSRLNLSANRGNNLIGARYYHTGPGPQGYPTGESPDDWPWYLHPNFWSKPAKAKIYPTDEQIDEMAKLGVNVFVLHQSWMRNGGSNTWPPADYTAQNPDELKRVIERCHTHGMRVGLYMRGVEAYSLYIPFFENYLQYDFDGLYVDWDGPLYVAQNHQSAFKSSETHFDAYAYFRYTKMLRKRVGENGFLIGHAWAEPTIFGVSVFDTYLPGEYIDQKEHLCDSPDKNIYFSMKTSCGAQMISYTAPRDKAIAYSAGLGSGLQNERGVLWQILKTIPMDKVWLYDNITENLQVVISSNPDFYTTVYKVSKDLLLIVTANTGNTGSSILQLDTSALGLIGQYSVTEMRGTDLNSFTTRHYGTIGNGTINTGSMEKYEIRGYKFERIVSGFK